jgi:hypothetical protein
MEIDDPGRFMLWIQLGHSDMQQGEQVAEALRGVASQLETGQLTGAVHDLNGNLVGSWSLNQEIAS